MAFSLAPSLERGAQAISNAYEQAHGLTRGLDAFNQLRTTTLPERAVPHPLSSLTKPVPRGNRGDGLTPRPWSAPKCTTIQVIAVAPRPWSAVPAGGHAVRHRTPGRKLADPRDGNALGGLVSEHTRQRVQQTVARERLPGVLTIADRRGQLTIQPPLFESEPPAKPHTKPWRVDMRTRARARAARGLGEARPNPACWDDSDGSKPDHLGNPLVGFLGKEPTPRRRATDKRLPAPVNRYRYQPAPQPVPRAENQALAVAVSTPRAKAAWKAGLGAPKPPENGMSVGTCIVF
jgi:hypothetical protein